MKQIKINCKEVLKVLLNKTKITDIRKAYFYCDECEGEGFFITDTEEGYATKEEECVECDGEGFIDKPSKYKVGDVCEVIWTGDYAPIDIENCPVCYQQRKFLDQYGRIPIGIELNSTGQYQHNHPTEKNQIIGKVKITSVEKIEISKIEEKGLIMHNPLKYIPDWKGTNFKIKFLSDKEIPFSFDELSDTVGFESVSKFFSWVEIYAPEIKDKPMPFWLYGMEWLE